MRRWQLSAAMGEAALEQLEQRWDGQANTNGY
jgi:hypothetical protein